MSEFFTNNMAVLKLHANGVVQHIVDHPRNSESRHGRLEPCVAKSGLPSLLVDGKAVHSMYHPQREADKVVNSLVAPLPTELPHYTFVVYEVGLGYYIQSLIEQCTVPTSLLIVIHDMDIFEYTINTRDISLWFQKHEVSIYVHPSPHELIQKLQSYAFTHIEELYVPALITNYRQSISVIQQEIKHYKTRQVGNRTTTEKFGALWVRNGIKNLRQLNCGAGYVDISQLRNAFTNIPAVIVGAGPTVDTLLEILKSLSNSCIIIAVDTVVRTLQLHNINPHFVVNVDPQYWNSQHLQQVSFEHSWVIHDICTHPLPIPSANPRIIMWSAIPIAQLLQTALGIEQSVSAGGSVTTSAWEAARWFGCSRAYLAGVDFAFPWNAVHCSSTLFEQAMLLNGHILKNAETELLCYLHHIPTHRALDYQKKEVLTNQSLMTYAQWLNTQHAHKHTMPTYTLSPHSLKLDSIEYLNPTTMSLIPLDIPSIIQSVIGRVKTAISMHDDNIITSERFSVIPIYTAILSQLLEWLQQHSQHTSKNFIDKVNELIDKHSKAIDKHRVSFSMLRDTVLMLGNISEHREYIDEPGNHQRIKKIVFSTLRQLATIKI